MTVNVDLTPPVEQGAGLQYGIIDSASLEGHTKKVQKPIMIAHLDELSHGCVKVFCAKADSEEFLYKMMRDYWGYVKQQQSAARKEKFEIARPLLNLMDEYKNAHFDIYSRWCDCNGKEMDRRSITQAWMGSLMGQLEKKILRLIYEYTIFSFYG